MVFVLHCCIVENKNLKEYFLKLFKKHFGYLFRNNRNISVLWINNENMELTYIPFVNDVNSFKNASINTTNIEQHSEILRFIKENLKFREVSLKTVYNLSSEKCKHIDLEYFNHYVFACKTWSLNRYMSQNGRNSMIFQYIVSENSENSAYKYKLKKSKSMQSLTVKQQARQRIIMEKNNSLNTLNPIIYMRSNIALINNDYDFVNCLSKSTELREYAFFMESLRYLKRVPEPCKSLDEFKYFNEDLGDFEEYHFPIGKNIDFICTFATYEKSEKEEGKVYTKLDDDDTMHTVRILEESTFMGLSNIYRLDSDFEDENLFNIKLLGESFINERTYDEFLRITTVASYYARLFSEDLKNKNKVGIVEEELVEVEDGDEDEEDEDEDEDEEKEKKVYRKHKEDEGEDEDEEEDDENNLHSLEVAEGCIYTGNGRKLFCIGFIDDGYDRNFLELFKEQFISKNSNKNSNECLEAFMHYTYQKSSKSLIIIDMNPFILPMKTLMTDPIIFSKKKKYGSADLGKKAIHHMLKKHVCNRICKMLALRRKKNY